MTDTMINNLWDSFDWADVESSDHYERDYLARVQVTRADRAETLRRKAVRAAKYATA